MLEPLATERDVNGKVLITGISGFVGNHLSRELLARGWQVHGLRRRQVPDEPRECTIHTADLQHPESLRDVPREWDWVIHLAAPSIPSHFGTAELMAQNLAMTMNLMDHVHSGRTLFVSSCHVYAPSTALHREDEPLHPRGRYGISKLLTEQLLGIYAHDRDIRIVRPFNHLGAGQRAELVIPTLIRRLRREGRDSRPLLMDGLDSIRDFIDVRDVMAAYVAVLEADDPSERIFNVCCGQGHRISELARIVMGILGLRRELRFLERPNSTDDIPMLVGDPARLRKLGWAPRHGLQESLQAMVEESCRREG
jgi:GDP-4-dehydro-6-deoxy-D-mannose reductase